MKNRRDSFQPLYESRSSRLVQQALTSNQLLSNSVLSTDLRELQADVNMLAIAMFRRTKDTRLRSKCRYIATCPPRVLTPLRESKSKLLSCSHWAICPWCYGRDVIQLQFLKLNLGLFGKKFPRADDLPLFHHLVFRRTSDLFLADQFDTANVQKAIKHSIEKDAYQPRQCKGSSKTVLVCPTEVPRIWRLTCCSVHILQGCRDPDLPADSYDFYRAPVTPLDIMDGLGTAFRYPREMLSMPADSWTPLLGCLHPQDITIRRQFCKGLLYKNPRPRSRKEKCRLPKTSTQKSSTSHSTLWKFQSG